MLAFIICCVLHLGPGDSPGSDQSMLSRDEAKWATRLGLQRSYVGKIVKAAGFNDQDEIRIENLDVRHLSAHKHILLVTAAGNGHCLILTVVAQKLGGSMQKIWDASETPEGGGFCHSVYTGDFKASATSKGQIIIDVPKDEKGQYVLDLRRLVYERNGETYVLRQHPGN